MRTRIARISSPHFVAGLIMADDECVAGADIIGYMIGWNEGRIEKYVKTKKWEITYGDWEEVPECKE